MSGHETSGSAEILGSRRSWVNATRARPAGCHRDFGGPLDGARVGHLDHLMDCGCAYFTYVCPTTGVISGLFLEESVPHQEGTALEGFPLCCLSVLWVQARASTAPAPNPWAFLRVLLVEIPRFPAPRLRFHSRSTGIVARAPDSGAGDLLEFKRSFESFPTTLFRPP